MPTVEEVMAQIQLLSLEDQVRLLEELVVEVRQRIADQEHHSIMELKGLGKEFWQEGDVEEYIEEELSSWRG